MSSIDASANETNLHWISAQSDSVTVNGLPWFEENGREFLRLPNRARDVASPDLWGVSRNVSGGRVRFRTDSTSLKLRILHGGGPLCMHHMCAVGTAGIDLYEGPPDRMTFWSFNIPPAVDKPYTSTYFEGLPKMMREFTLYLPAYSNLSALEIGLDPGARVEKPSPFRLPRPVVFYGTSITQGGCSSRGSNGFVPMIGRRLGVDIVNLGFSGLGRCEPEMAGWIAEIDAAAYVIDPVANMPPALMEERYAPFVGLLRQRRPDHPIILMTRIRYAQENYGDTETWISRTNVVRETYEQRLAGGDRNIFYFDAGEVIGIGGDHPSVDGCHLTDEGFRRLEQALSPILGRILFGS
jgi:hypothetical protein